MIIGFAVASIGSDVGSLIVSALSATLGRALVDADGYVSAHLFEVLNTVGDPQLGSSWFAIPLVRLLPAVEIVAVASLLVAAITSVVQGDPASTLRSILVYLPVMAIFAGGEVGLVEALLRAGNGLSESIFASFVPSASGGVALHGTFAALLGPGVPTLIGVGIAVLYVVFALLLWFELALRAAAIYMVVAILPFAFAMSLFRSGRKMLFRLLEVLAGLIFVKVVIALGLGISAGVATSANLSNLTVAVVATASLILCVLSPFAALRLLVAIDFAQAPEFERAPTAGLRIARRAASFADQNLAASQAGSEVVDYGHVPYASGRKDLAGDWESHWPQSYGRRDDG